MKRPWNIIDTPVYSLATYKADAVNMNICTYVTAISMQPKMYAIGVYEKTKTLANLQHNSSAVLQLLHPDQISLVQQLGKKSGFRFNKQSYLHKKGLLDNWNGFTVLKGCAAYLLLQKSSSVLTGDHELYIFDTLKYKTISENVLQFQQLISDKIIL